MAVYKIFPSQDATLYSAYINQNTGLDEILEATTNFITGSTRIDGAAPQTSRFLIKFSDTDIAYVTSSLATGDFQANLKLFIANSSGLKADTVVLANAVAEDWEMGTGRYLDSPETQNGVSWLWTDYSGSSKWTTSSFTSGTTGSYSGSNVGGGVWWTGSEVSQTFGYYSDLDLNFNVTEIVKNWTGSSSVWSNYGFIVRQTQSQEFIDNINQQVNLKYYSRDTHTIYPPTLEFKWDDFSYNTGSLTVLNTLPATLTLAENPGTFFSESINKFYINARPEYPIRVWQTASYYTNNFALPTASYYAIKDLDTDEYIIDFDTTYTKLSCDASGSYFTLYMNGLEPERNYKVLIQTTINGSTVVYDDDYYFKVVNG
jgi:hypothetical protein